MVAFLSVILMIISVLLVAVVLLQPGKGDMISGLGGMGGQFNALLGTRKAMNFLSKTTMALAAAIIVLSLTTNLFFVGNEEAGPRPVIEGVDVPMDLPDPGAGLPQAPPPQPNE